MYVSHAAAVISAVEEADHQVPTENPTRSQGNLKKIIKHRKKKKSEREASLADPDHISPAPHATQRMEMKYGST